jgi:hypothetical protein
MTNSTKPATSFWVIGVLALLWNSTGIMAYLEQTYMTVEDLASLPEAEQAFYNNLPAWVTAAFAIAVFSGTLGCIALLLRKRSATILFLLSLIAVIAQFVRNVFMQKDMEVTATNMLWSVLVIVIAIFLVWYSKKSTSKGWIS